MCSGIGPFTVAPGFLHALASLTLICLLTHPLTIPTNLRTTVNNGYLGSRNDEERSEMRYVMRIAEFSESSNL
ncbi:hypothetical protein G9A89_002147 [Geosiphon pyriformis]|nr:hypothetical protein G9A89_002147 [Geosiphon pyriformis]